MKWLFLVRRIYLPRNGADPCRTPALKRNLAFLASGAGDASIALLILAGLLHRNDCKVGVWQALHEGQQLFYAPSPGRVLFGSSTRRACTSPLKTLSSNSANAAGAEGGKKTLLVSE